MITYSGIHVTQEFGAPCVRDIAIQLMRLGRFCGSGEKWWPVGLHSMAVADLVMKRVKGMGESVEKVAVLIALIHDGEESVVNDVPKPMKTKQQKELGDDVRLRIYDLLGIGPYLETIDQIVKQADLEICCAEAHHGFGPRGFSQLQNRYEELLTEEAVLAVGEYKNYQYADCLNSNGFWVGFFERRILNALREYHLIDYTVPA